MARLNFRNTTPPDGWRFRDPTTGADFTGWTLLELTERVIAHRKWKGIEPTDPTTVSLEVERHICAGAAPGVCSAENGEDYRPLLDQHRTLDSEKIMSFTGAALRFIKSGAKLVDKAESERRADICRKCQFNKTSVCVCTPIYKIIESLVPSERVEPGLAICSICGCVNRVRVLLPIDTIRTDEADKHHRYPSFCWLNQP